MIRYCVSLNFGDFMSYGEKYSIFHMDIHPISLLLGKVRYFLLHHYLSVRILRSGGTWNAIKRPPIEFVFYFRHGSESLDVWEFRYAHHD